MTKQEWYRQRERWRGEETWAALDELVNGPKPAPDDHGFWGKSSIDAYRESIVDAIYNPSPTWWRMVYANRHKR